ncbi:MAG: hypothetical protein JWO77_2476 [Ilumatobacteraceae bacterium]|nr:hypothetical protein [Ilumatobacteraceae bacterium]
MADEVGEERPGRLRRSLARHRALAIGIAVATAGFASYGLATGSDVAVPYAVMVLGGMALVATIEPDDGFSGLALAGLSTWALGHLAGGIIGIAGDRVLYNALLLDPVHWDNLVHFVGFGTAGLVWWEAVQGSVRVDRSHAVGVGVAVWFVGMGVGALNEVIEFIATLVLPDTNVGGYHNTGRDLIANLLGAATAAVVVVRRIRREPSADSPD